MLEQATTGFAPLEWRMIQATLGAERYVGSLAATTDAIVAKMQEGQRNEAR